jgi:hypothetical protein
VEEEVAADDSRPATRDWRLAARDQRLAARDERSRLPRLFQQCESTFRWKKKKKTTTIIR